MTDPEIKADLRLLIAYAEAQTKALAEMAQGIRTILQELADLRRDRLAKIEARLDKAGL